MASGRRARGRPRGAVHGYCGPAIHRDDATVPLRVIQLSDGNLVPSDVPGNGYNLKTADAAPYRVV